MEKLKLCPRCGGKPKIRIETDSENERVYTVYCKCGNRTARRKAEAEAREAWNAKRGDLIG